MAVLASIFSTASIFGPVWLNLSLILGLALLYKFTKKDERISKFLDKIPGPKSYPVIGSGWTFLRPIRDIMPLLLSFANEYGPVVKMWALNKPYVFILGSDDVGTILSSTKQIDKSHDYDILGSWIGLSVATINGDPWKSRRKMLNPLFHTGILEKLHMGAFNQQSNTFVDVLRKDHADTGRPFDIYVYFKNCCLDIIAEAAMGIQLNSQLDESGLEYCKAVEGITDLYSDTFTRPWEQSGLIWRLSGKHTLQKNYIKILHAFTEKVIAERKRMLGQDDDTLKPSGKYQKPFLDLILDFAKDGLMTDKDIRQEVDTFMFAGYEVTLANASWTTWLLASHPEHQKLVQEELETIFGSDINRDITMADLSNMKYLEYCIKEALRMMPPGAFIGRHLNEDITLANGVQIPAGVTAIIPIIVNQRDPKVFPNPATFNPDRFNPENSKGRHPYSYVPFSAGPRNCIGQKFAIIELKILLAKFYMNYTVEPVEKYTENMVLIPQVIYRPKTGIWVKITSRH